MEQLAHQYGWFKKNESKKTAGITETEVNNLKLKFTKDSVHGEILKICREMMTEETFDKILPDILKLTRSGHDITTKSTAVMFISDSVLENQDMVSPKNSRLIARRLVEVYSQNTVQTCLTMKQSLLQMYASCLGHQMKILKDFPNTVKQVVDSLA